MKGLCREHFPPLETREDRGLRESGVGGWGEVEGGGGITWASEEERREYWSWAGLRGGSRTFLPSGGPGTHTSRWGAAKLLFSECGQCQLPAGQLLSIWDPWSRLSSPFPTPIAALPWETRGTTAPERLGT